jgi:hypothetical protein
MTCRDAARSTLAEQPEIDPRALLALACLLLPLTGEHPATASDDGTPVERSCLEARGHIPHPVGRELAPPKRLFFLAEEELAAGPHRRQVPVRLHSELLLARSLAFLLHVSAKERT